MTVVTRFAPSPTGFLHIGGVRTAYFNWLHARHHGGRFCLRVEDTDRRRSTPQAVDAILDGLAWLGLEADGEIVYQSKRRKRHLEVAHKLLASGRAYHCYATAEELEAMREEARKAGKPPRYDGRWRDRHPSQAPADTAPSLRLRAPRHGRTVISDLIQGKVAVNHEELDDMVLVRADGTPTYMLAAAVDDHDMELTHVIRGDDHLTNTFRQLQLYEAMDWRPPAWAHMPLLHGSDGGKLSKRHGATALSQWRDMGYLPEALLNYLLRLGWAHGDEEVISRKQAVAWFDIKDVKRAAARFDQARLKHLNAHYLRNGDDHRLIRLLAERSRARGAALDGCARDRLEKALPDLKPRAGTLSELEDQAAFLNAARPVAQDEDAAALLRATDPALFSACAQLIKSTSPWRRDILEVEARKAAAECHGGTLRHLAQPLRAALTGRTVSPPLFTLMELLGREECAARMEDVRNSSTQRIRT